MEYLGNCPKCNRHIIVKTIKRIKHKPNERLPQRTAKCYKCGATARITILGEIGKLAKSTDIVQSEYDQQLNSYALQIHLWR